ncbi:hypothetical protein L1987_58437 [Smallanthus sonchifolius]|uniref:Uncharacterized protein n=1 Tax=Smallanthus sonchifolius TaxID=185202 RepID=A0ACB9DFS7_9ASTR|nr:hypothetical protein L1987_58437 [Smallanthus sonchifolius]
MKYFLEVDHNDYSNSGFWLTDEDMDHYNGKYTYWLLFNIHECIHTKLVNKVGLAMKHLNTSTCKFKIKQDTLQKAVKSLSAYSSIKPKK